MYMTKKYRLVEKKPKNEKVKTVIKPSAYKNVNSSQTKKVLTEKQMEKLKEHSKMHKGGMNSKHIKNMKKFMENGDSFTVAHNKAKKLD